MTIMENRPIIKKEQVETVYDSRFIKVFDLQYEPGKHYFDATRRSKDHLAAVKSDEEFRQMLPDAVSCVVSVVGSHWLPWWGATWHWAIFSIPRRETANSGKSKLWN